MRKTEMWANYQGFEFKIGRTECGQIVVKLSPAEWEALPPWAQDVVVKLDILLAAEWALQHTWTKKEGEWLLCSQL